MNVETSHNYNVLKIIPSYFGESIFGAPVLRSANVWDTGTLQVLSSFNFNGWFSGTIKIHAWPNILSKAIMRIAVFADEYVENYHPSSMKLSKKNPFLSSFIRTLQKAFNF
jgi:hypothetical protein